MLQAIASFFRRLFGRQDVSASLALPSGTVPANAAAQSSVSPVSVSEPYGMARDEWDPSLVRAAWRMAERGDLRLCSDLCETLLGDDRLRSVFATRAAGVIGADISFEPGARGDGRRRKKAIKAIEVDEDWWEIFPEPELTKLLIWGILAGWCWVRIHPTELVDHDGRLLPRIEVWGNRWFSYDFKEKSWYRVDAVGGLVPVVSGDGEWALFAPFGNKRPWAMGLWRGLAIPYLLKVYAERDWARYSEAHGNPAWVVSGEKDHKKRQELAALFGDLARNPAVALGPGITVELLEATASSWENFSLQIQTANIAYAVSVIGGNLAAEVDKNQQTGATAQTLVRIDYKRFDAQALSTFCHDQVLVWWSVWNFGDERLAPWPLYDVEPKEDAKATADTWHTVALAASEFAKAGFELDVEEVVLRFNIPLRKMTAELSALPQPDQQVPSKDTTK